MNKDKILRILKNIATIIVIIALFIIIFYQNRDRDIFKFGKEESERIISSNQSSISDFAEGNLGKAGENIALLTTTSYSVNTAHGDAESVNVAFSKPVLHTEDKYAVCYDLEATDIFVYKETEEIYRIKTESKLFSAKVNKNGYLFTANEKDGYNCECRVYNTMGELIFKWDISKSEFLDGDVNSSNDAIVLSLSSGNENKLIGEIVHININNAEIINRNSYEDAIFFSVNFNRNDTCIALGNKMLNYYNTDGTEKWSYNYEGKQLLKADVSNYDMMALAFSGAGEMFDGNSSEIKVLNRLGKVTGEKSFDGSIDDISAGTECIAIARDKEIFVVDSKLKEKKSLATTYRIKKIALFDDNESVFVLGSTNSEICR